MNERIEYLESLIPTDENILEDKYFHEFEKFASYTGNGTYEWMGIRATDTRELWLMGALMLEGIEYEEY